MFVPNSASATRKTGRHPLACSLQSDWNAPTGRPATRDLRRCRGPGTQESIDLSAPSCSGSTQLVLTLRGRASDAVARLASAGRGKQKPNAQSSQRNASLFARPPNGLATVQLSAPKYHRALRRMDDACHLEAEAESSNWRALLAPARRKLLTSATRRALITMRRNFPVCVCCLQLAKTTGGRRATVTGELVEGERATLDSHCSPAADGLVRKEQTLAGPLTQAPRPSPAETEPNGTFARADEDGVLSSPSFVPPQRERRRVMAILFTLRSPPSPFSHFKPQAGGGPGRAASGRLLSSQISPIAGARRRMAATPFAKRPARGGPFVHLQNGAQTSADDV